MHFSTELINLVRKAQRIVVLSGAGISKESGIPTFREAQTGLWAQYDPAELATPEAFNQNPKLVWDWYKWRQELVRKANPNPGHMAIAAMESHISQFTLITQNVDGLHARAGSQRILELHGNILRARQVDDNVIVNTWDEQEELPRDPQTGGLLRPDVVWFGENLPAEVLEVAYNASQRAQLFFSIGTSSIVHPAASLPIVALQSGATIVEINPETTPLTPIAQHSISGVSGEVLPELVKAVWG